MNILKIVIATDSFKGSLSSVEAGQAIAEGVRRYLPDSEIVIVPIADGGEGTMESLVTATQGRKNNVLVTGPLGQSVEAAYGCLGDGRTCVIEMASASGLGLVPESGLNPMVTTTYGTGELIKHALDHGFRHFILALGGSATNDGGVGMLQALGMRVLDSRGNSVGFGGEALKDIATIDSTTWDSRIAESSFLIASDVQNPLIGPMGASHVFGPQKGATPEMVALLDNYLRHFADLVATTHHIRLHNLPGAGAAGGIGAAFQAFFPSRMQRGIDVVMEYVGLRKTLKHADVVFTGEGKIDFQTASGKTPMGVAQEAQRYGIPTIVLAGSIGQGIDALYEHGIQSVHSIVSGPMTIEQAIANARQLLADRAEQVMRTFVIVQNKSELRMEGTEDNADVTIVRES